MTALPGQLAALFNGEGRVGVQRVSADKYRLLVHLGSERYYVHELARGHTVGDIGLATQAHILGSSWIGSPMKTVAARDATRTEVGSWSWGTGTGTSLNSEYRSGSTPGDTLTFTTPAGQAVDRLGVYLYRHPTVGGVHAVAIDGRRGTANLLPTAAEYVALGKLPASALTTNGGRLLPHDRVIDNVPRGGLTGRDWTPVASGLAPGQHTISFIASGHTHPGVAGGTRVMVEGYGYGTPTMAWNDASIDFLPLWGVLVTDGSAHEYAHQLQPSAGTAPSVFVGCIHGYEQQAAAPTFTLDGAALSLSDGQIAMGATLAIHRPTALHHPYDAPTLTAAISNSDTVVPLTAIPSWVPQSGYVTIEAEVMHYSSRTSSQLNIDLRADGSAGSGGAAAHAQGVAVNFDPGVKIADVDTTYTITRTGIETLHLTTFLEAVKVIRAYPVMFPVDGSQMTHAFLGATEHAMTANANGEFGHVTETQVVFFTDRAAAIPDTDLTPFRVAVLGEVFDPADTVENWTYSGESPANLHFFLQDRTPSDAAHAISHMHKGYPTHVAAPGPGRTFPAGTVWRSRSRRMAQLVTDHNYSFRNGTSVNRGRARAAR